MLTKKVDGITVVMSSIEEAAIRAEWAENSRPRTAQETSDANDVIVDREFNTDVVRVILDHIAPLINPALNGQDLLSAIKAKRKAEL